MPAGRSRQEFPDVSAQIRSETVTLTGAGIGIVEQNFDFDLLSPQALMQKAVGETITLVRTNPATGAETRERARVLAANGGVVLQIGERIEVLRDDGLPVRVIFDRVPENLRARPDPVGHRPERARRPPPADAHLSDPGPGWQADYVALFDEAKPDGRAGLDHADQQQRHAPIRNADTLLVAGAVGQEQPEGYRPTGRSRRPDPRRGNGKRGSRADRRFLPLSAGRADDDRQPPDQAGQLPRRRRHAGDARL